MDNDRGTVFARSMREAAKRAREASDSLRVCMAVLDREGERWSISASAYSRGDPLVKIGGECIVLDGTDHVYDFAHLLIDAADDAEKDGCGKDA